jgi:hypothetical protein
MMRRFFVAVTLLLLMPTSARADWHQREAAIMGTRITAELWHEESTAGQAALDAVFAEMHRIDRLKSHYKPNSQLSRINRDAAAGPVVVDHELALLIAKSLELPELFGTGVIRIEPKGTLVQTPSRTDQLAYVGAWARSRPASAESGSSRGAGSSRAPHGPGRALRAAATPE